MNVGKNKPLCHLESAAGGREISSHDLMRFLATLEMTD